MCCVVIFFFQAEDGIRDSPVTGVQTCALPISCVGLVEPKDYAFDVNQAVEYLKGNNQHVFDEFLKKMDQASSEQEYEKAVFYRNQISSLKVIQAHQFADGKRQIDLDAVAITQEADIFCVAVLFVRGGRILGRDRKSTRLNSSHW